MPRFNRRWRRLSDVTSGPQTLLLASIAALCARPLGAQAASCVATSASLTPKQWVGPASSQAQIQRGPLRLIADVRLPGPANRFDYQSVDPASGRLYISHMNAGRLVVFDLDSLRVVHEVAGVDRAT